MAESEKQTITAADVGTVKIESGKEKTPRLKQLFNELWAQKQILVTQMQEHRDYHDKHVNDAKFLEARKRIKELNKEIGPLDNELAGLARALGARGIKAETGTFEGK